MRRICFPLLLATISTVLISSYRPAKGCGFNPDDLNEMSVEAVSKNPATAKRAIKALRAAGPKGLQALLDVHAEELRLHANAAVLGPKQVVAGPVGIKLTPTEISTAAEVNGKLQAWESLSTAIDEVSGQRDCQASRLYWYTDLEAAKAAARREGKPILSLRLLGKLSDEYSCANSRFFRTTLYSNQQISDVLRTNFILHWKSVRPAPRVTIDFGDGRRLTRTITGNSIHYVLDEEGRVIDALPGLYGPQAFLRELRRGVETAKQVASLPPEQRETFLVDFHRTRAAALETAWQDDLKKLGIPFVSTPIDATTANGNGKPLVAQAQTAPPTPNAPAADSRMRAAEQSAEQPVGKGGRRPPTAAMAGAYAISKGFVENPMIRAITFRPAEALKRATTDDVWNRIAELHRADAELDPASLVLIRSKNPTAGQAAPLAFSKMVVESPLVRMVRNLQGAMALDTVRNEYLFHREIHRWLAAAPTPALDVFNERVYSELFLTPSSDPWLGLMPADTYSALDNNGMQ